LLIGLEAEKRRYGTERFFFRDLHFGTNIRQHGRFEEGLPKSMPLAAKQNTRPF
jgi:hypothetical protein